MTMIRRNSLFVDTSGWDSFLDTSQPEYQATRKAYTHAVRRRRRMVTTNYVINELVALLTTHARFPRPQVIRAIETITTSEHVDVIFIDPATHQEAWDLLKARPDKEWSLVDASSFVVMRRHGLTEALTTDHHFVQAGFVRVPEQGG